MSTKPETVTDSVEMIEELSQELIRQLDLLSGSNTQENLSYGQYKIISAVNGHSPISMGELGRLIGAPQSTVSEMITRLNRAGLVAKVRGLSDGRMVMVELTEPGRQLLRRRRRRVREAYRKLFDKLGNHERGEFITAMRTLNNIFSSVSE
jgi:DNA-binding MarR family transcriptional regulator